MLSPCRNLHRNRGSSLDRPAGFTNVRCEFLQRERRPSHGRSRLPTYYPHRVRTHGKQRKDMLWFALDTWFKNVFGGNTLGSRQRSQCASSGRRGRCWFQSSRPDLKSKQLVALIRSELFLVWCVRVKRTTKPNSESSNKRQFSRCNERQLLETVGGAQVAEFKSSRHSRGVQGAFESAGTSA